MIETDVLIVGSGPAGSASALALSTYGVPNVLVTKYRWLANTPRAHITNQRTFEVLRDLDVEAEAKALAVPQDWMGNTVFCASLAGEELGRIHTWGTHPARRADYRLASPCEMGDLPQTLLEPILLGNAAARGTRVRFDTEYLSLEHDAVPAKPWPWGAERRGLGHASAASRSVSPPRPRPEARAQAIRPRSADTVPGGRRLERGS
jgi:2,4-dichlorophenol 6-monooxygenase